jgi:hypothetical protein
MFDRRFAEPMCVTRVAIGNFLDLVVRRLKRTVTTVVRRCSYEMAFIGAYRDSDYSFAAAIGNL